MRQTLPRNQGGTATLPVASEDDGVLCLLRDVCPGAAGSGAPAGRERAQGPGQADRMDERGLRSQASPSGLHLLTP